MTWNLPDPDGRVCNAASASGSWHDRKVVEAIRLRARDLRTEAARLDGIADKIESPPEGVRVEYGSNGVVRFVGPTVEVTRG